MQVKYKKHICLNLLAIATLGPVGKPKWVIGRSGHDFSSTHPPDCLDFFGTQIFFNDPNFNPNTSTTQSHPLPNHDKTFSQTRVWLCKPSLFYVSVIQTID